MEDKNYILNVQVQQIKFQVNWKINLFNEFNNIVDKIEQNLVLPSNLYSVIDSKVDLTYKIDQHLKPFYDKNQYFVYTTSELSKVGNNEQEYNQYRHNKFGGSGTRLADFDSKKILAPVKYIIKVNVSSKNISWLSKEVEKTISITERP